MSFQKIFPLFLVLTLSSSSFAFESESSYGGQLTMPYANRLSRSRIPGFQQVQSLFPQLRAPAAALAAEGEDLRDLLPPQILSEGGPLGQVSIDLCLHEIEDIVNVWASKKDQLTEERLKEGLRWIGIEDAVVQIQKKSDIPEKIMIASLNSERAFFLTRAGNNYNLLGGGFGRRPAMTKSPTSALPYPNIQKCTLEPSEESNESVANRLDSGKKAETISPPSQSTPSSSEHSSSAVSSGN